MRERLYTAAFPTGRRGDWRYAASVTSALAAPACVPQYRLARGRSSKSLWCWIALCAASAACVRWQPWSWRGVGLTTQLPGPPSKQ